MTMPREPRVSIVINTLDRADWLRRLLPALETVDYPAFEVIVVNGPSRDDTQPLLDGLAGRIKARRCPEPNLSRSRNIGIAAAAGEVVVFIDDDALPANPQWLRHLVAPLVDDPRLGAVGGPVLRGDEDAWEFQGRVASDYGELREPLEAAALGLVTDGRRWVQYTQGNNCAFRRDALVAIGGFDETFTYDLDEVDVCLRLARSGRPIGLAPRAIVRHYAASAAHRKSWHDRNWDVMARSDAYYCLKNGDDDLRGRLGRMRALMYEKWPYQAIVTYHRQGAYGRKRRAYYLAKWWRGTIAGVGRGLLQRRRLPLRADTPPPAFVPYREPQHTEEGAMDVETIKAKVFAREWFHRIDLGHGIVTPGIDDSQTKLDGIGMPADLRGKSVLDIGAYDGFFSFAAERRGAARVVAADKICWNLYGMATKDGFELARQALGSRVEDVEIAVEDITPERVGVFDVVMMLGVLYHSEDPFRYIRIASAVCREMLILETHVDAEDYPRPAMVFYPGATLNGDTSNWWGPNRAAVEGMLLESGFARVEANSWFPRRMAFRAFKT
jgi:tRNA (mo5U34)-methyltransferase